MQRFLARYYLGFTPSNGDTVKRNIRVRLDQASVMDLVRHRQCFHHILSIGVATHFWSNLSGLLRNLSNLFRTTRQQMLSVNWCLVDLTL